MTIQQLKDEGHKLLEEYIQINKGRFLSHVKAYQDLEKVMHGKNPHFGEMKSKLDVLHAIGSLKKMIYRKKNNLPT